MNNLDSDILCLNIITRKMKQYKNSHYSTYNLNSAQINILMGIKDAGPMRKNEIADYISIEPKISNKLLDDLVQQGYLERSAAEDDRRVAVFVATKQAKELFPYLESVGRKYAADLTNGMSDDEKEQWSKLLRIAADNSMSMIKSKNDYNKRWVYINTDNMDSHDATELARLLNIASTNIDAGEADPSISPSLDPKRQGDG